jgi:predicted TPR repeat methyltransferase
MEQPPKTREVSLEEAISMAILFQRNGQLDDAAKVYQRIFDVTPDHPDVLHYAGVLAHQQGRSDEGIALIRRSLDLEPDQADCYSNLGIIFKARGRDDEAIEAYRHAISLNPDHANAYNNLGVLLKAQGHLAEAEAQYQQAIRLNPEHLDAYHNLGVLLAGQKRTQEAVAYYCKARTIDTRHRESRRLLALAYCTLGEPDKAVEIFERWLEEDPENLVAQHMLAACSGRNVPARASDGYVEKIFDDFAPSFDSKLTQLGYRAPRLILAMLEDAGATPAKALDILDAGCGTGLCGPLIVPYARRLVGVDLSSGMLDRAQETAVYDELVKDELTAYLEAHLAAFDVIVSADTLVYFGALNHVVEAASAALRPHGLLIFTLEAASESSADFNLGHHGRYSHTAVYVERLLVGADLRPEIVHAELRMEGGAPVPGLAVRAIKV